MDILPFLRSKHRMSLPELYREAHNYVCCDCWFIFCCDLEHGFQTHHSEGLHWCTNLVIFLLLTNKNNFSITNKNKLSVLPGHMVEYLIFHMCFTCILCIPYWILFCCICYLFLLLEDSLSDCYWVFRLSSWHVSVISLWLLECLPLCHSIFVWL